MKTERQSPHDTQGPLRRIVSSVFAIVETRLELIGIELAQEKERLIGVLFLGLAAMMLSMMALITLTVLVAIAFWDTYRWQSLVVITLVYALTGSCSITSDMYTSAPIVGGTTLDYIPSTAEAPTWDTTQPELNCVAPAAGAPIAE